MRRRNAMREDLARYVARWTGDVRKARRMIRAAAALFREKGASLHVVNIGWANRDVFMFEGAIGSIPCGAYITHQAWVDGGQSAARAIAFMRSHFVRQGDEVRL